MKRGAKGKYSKKKVKEIIELYSSGKYNNLDLCTKAEISQETFFKWKREKPEFSEALKDAEDQRQNNFKEMALSGLAKLLDGYEYEEITMEGKPEKPTFIKKTKKFIPPNPTAVIFTLTNTDPANFKHKSEVQHSTDGTFTFNLITPETKKDGE